jgi:D-glycero-alpha-D-manno-heptose-7-phosphate kinase
VSIEVTQPAARSSGIMHGVGDARAIRVVNAVAPIRVCDNGGWTDTWFAGHGKVFNIGVYPYVEVQVKVHPDGALANRVVLDAENYGERYTFSPGVLPDRHPLLEAAVDDVGVPDDLSIEISIYSDAPVGCSTGTSAAVTVALMGALDALTPDRMTPHEIAYAAHRIEVERLGLQSGIQDQLCAAYGGINYIEMFSYPHASVSQLSVPNTVWWELERRLVLVFLGRTHVSSHVHEAVIADLERHGDGGPQLEELRQAAEQARDAVHAADLAALGRAMTHNTDLQARLHPSLVSKEAHAAIEVAAANGAQGWKVNGAGGEGGSLTLLCGPDMRLKRQLLAALRDTDPLFQIIPTYLSRYGLRVWDS